MNRTVIIIVGSIIVLLVGIAVVYPMLFFDSNSFSKTDLMVDILYAYISPLNSHSNETGLWWNNSVVDMGSASDGIRADGTVVSYLFVLNVTNNFNKLVQMKGFEVKLGPQITVNADGSIFANNPLVSDSRHFSFITAETDDIWSPQSSKLIGLSGVIGVHEAPFSSLNSTTFIYSYVEGQIALSGNGQMNSNYSLKQVQFQTVGDAYLYNNLLNENQILLFYQGLEVNVATRR